LWNVIPVLLACFLVGRTAQAATPFDYSANIGMALQKEAAACLYIGNDRFTANQQLRFVNILAPHSDGEVEIVSKADEQCKDANQEQPGMTRYSLKVIRGTLRKGAPAFAIANFDRPFRRMKNGIAADLDGDGRQEIFRTCTSSEGVHLTIWKGAALKGKRRWHGYDYLGYDVTANCTASETR